MAAKAPSAARVDRVEAKAAKAGTGDVRTKITWQGREYVLAQSDIGPGDDARCRAQTAAYTGGQGYTLTGLLQAAAQAAQSGDVATAGLDVLAALLWTMRRKNGEPDLRLGEVFDSFTAKDMVDGLAIEVEVDEPGEGAPPGG